MRVVARLLAASTIAVFAFTAVFVEAFHAPRPHRLTVGVVGSPSAADRIQSQLDARSPGAFRVRAFTTESSGRDALKQADIHAVLVPERRAERLLVAGVSGVPSTQLATDAFRALAVRARTTLRVHDVAPLPAHDRLGLSALFTVVGTLLPSLGFGALLAFAGGRLPSRMRWSAIAAYAVLAGIVIALGVDVMLGALTGAFGGLAVVCALLAFAAAGSAHALVRLAGPGGLAASVAVLVPLGLTSTGGAVTPPLQPAFYSALSGWLPPGAALEALRNIVYFDWSRTSTPLLALAAWGLACVAVEAASAVGRPCAPAPRRSR